MLKLLAQLIYIGLLALPVYAQGSKEALPILQTKASSKQLIEEVIHPYSVTSYVNEWKIPLISANDQSSPETTLASYLSALRSGQYERALDLWEAKSKGEILKLNVIEKKSKEDWLRIWKTSYSDKDFLLRERVRYGERYVLLPYYRLNSDAVRAPSWIETLAMIKEGDKWFLTLDLAATPLPSNWMTGGARTQRMSDLFLKK